MARKRELERYESLPSTPLLSCSTITTRERLQLCCKPTYKPRRVKSKAAILMLVWNYLIMNVFGLLNKYIDSGYAFRIWLVAFGLTPPIAGWLADACIGRYKVISCSVWIMWIATVLATVSSVIAQLVGAYFCIDTKVQLVLLVIMAIGLGGYQANIIQFGLDQLYDASTTEITSFIVWYIWTAVSACFTVDFVFACLSEQQGIIRSLFVCSSVTLALILLLCHHHWLMKEPVKDNPFKLVYQVLKYAIKTKQPQHRSAFTYCEDDLPSRIDFGKSKYGGPFTTEQVEDVKTFLRLIPMAIVGGALAGGLFTTNYLRDIMYDVIKVTNFSSANTSLRECYLEASFSRTIYYSGALLIILHEGVIYPVFHRCFPQIESLRKVLIGMLLQIARVFVLMAYIIVLRRTSKGQIQCLFHLTNQNTQDRNIMFSHYWIAIPDFLETISVIMLQVGAAEFLSAQVPHFMKGLMIGMTYCSLFVSSAIWFLLSIPFTKKKFGWDARTISCGFWLSLILAVTQICICPFLIILTRWYKKRRRQDVLPNEHIFAERYYSMDT